MSEVEEMKKKIEELADRDYRLINDLTRVSDALQFSREILYSLLSSYKQLRSTTDPHLRDFYDYALFNILHAASHAENARKLVEQVLDAYKGKGPYWKDIEEEEVEQE
jgi:N-glycosylase/DNA lyase